MDKDKLIADLQVKVAELEKQLNLHKNAHHKAVEILQEQSNAEPFAWYKYYKEWGEHDFTKANDEGTLWTKEQFEKDGYTPLYTTPQTKLSNEEIDEVINGTAWVGTEEEIRLKIARAIEERHGIK